MTSDNRSPEFGPNGSVLNSETMSEPLKQKYVREEAKSKAWLRWAVFFVPLTIAAMASASVFGFATVLPILVVLFVASSLYQRFKNRRSWGSILWGLEASKN